MTLCLFLSACLMLVAGLLALAMGNAFVLLALLSGFLVAATAKRWLARANLLPGFIIALLIFLSGTPAFGGPSSVLLVSAAASIYFLTWLQTLRLRHEPGAGVSSNLLANSPVGLFTASFYATLLLAFLCLQGHDLPFHHIIALLVAALVLMLGLALWETSRRSRLRSTPQAQAIPLRDRLARLSVIILLFLATFLLFRLPLPWLAHHAIGLASQALPERTNPLQLPETPPPGADAAAPDEITGGPLEGEGEGNGATPSELGRFPESFRGLPRQADIQLDNTVRFLLTLESNEDAVEPERFDRPLYVRAFAAGDFENDTWRPVPHNPVELTDATDGQTDGRVTLRQPAPAGRARQVAHTLYHYHYNGGALLSLPNPLAFGIEPLLVRGDGYHSVDRSGHLRYDVVSRPLRYEDLEHAGLSPGDADPIYLETPQGTLWRDVDATILAPVNGADITLSEQLAFLKEHFTTSYRYSLQIKNPDRREPLENFLFHEKTGYCDFFAQAGALMLRRLGIPSRIAYGYAGGVYDRSHGVHAFRGRDAHSWIEIFLRDHGWVTYDLTPRGQGAHHAPEMLVSGSAESPLTRFLRPAEEPEDTGLQTDEGPRLPDFSRWSMPDLSFVAYLDAILLILGAALLVTYVVQKLRNRQRTDDPDDRGLAETPPPPGYFNDFCHLFARLGHPRQAGETLREYMAQLKQANWFDEQFEPLLAYHYQTRYEGENRRRETERRFQREIKEFGRKVRSAGSVQGAS